MNLQMSAFQAEGRASSPELSTYLSCYRKNSKANVTGVRQARGKVIREEVQG